MLGKKLEEISKFASPEDYVKSLREFHHAYHTNILSKIIEPKVGFFGKLKNRFYEGSISGGF